jgi:FHS family L-fucose permease-like MFS transporter
MMKRIAPSKLLGLFAACAFLCTLTAIAGTGAASVWAVVLLGFFDSIMFPTIFALSIKNLGAYTKLGSALLVMSIVGGALLPAVMGYVSDVSSIQRAFVVPLVCYACVIYFAFRGCQPVEAT